MEEKRLIGVPGDSDSVAVQVRATAPAIAQLIAPETVWEKLRRGRWLLLWTAVAFSMLAMLLRSAQPALYKEQTSIEVRSPEIQSAGGGAVTLDKLADLDAVNPKESYVQTQIRIIQSRSLLERAMVSLSDADKARLAETPHFWWRHNSHNQIVQSILNRISAQPAGQAGIVDITFLSPDPSVGAHFLNLLTQELQDFNVERQWRAAQHNRQWAEREIDDLRRKWEQSQQVLAEYAQSSGVQASIVSAPARSQPVGAAKVVSEASDPKLKQLKSKLADLQKQISEWQALYGPSGAVVLKFKSEASATEAAIRQRRAAFRVNFAPAPGIVATKTAAKPQPQGPAQAHLQALQQEAESNRVLFQKTENRLKEAAVVSPTQIGDISMVDPAIPALKPATPSQFLTGVVGGFIGLLLGTTFVALRDRFSTTFSEPAVLGQYLGLHVLGATPVDRLANLETTYGTDNQEPALQLNFDTDTKTAEAFRTIRSSILLGAGQRIAPRRLVFTSAGNAEGKTFVVGNLGAALAGAQRRVLLVDGNLRNPSLHKIFGASNDHGLADLLGKQIAEQPITSRDVIRETQIPDLFLLSAGQAGVRAPEILSSVQLPQLIREFAKGFDLVLMDSPPVLAYADARSLARAADGVVLIVKAGSTNREVAMQARDVITQDGATIIGTILTEWDAVQTASA